MTDAELAAAGVSPDLVRLSVRHWRTCRTILIADLEQALEQVYFPPHPPSKRGARFPCPQKKGLLLVFCAALLFSIGGLCVKMIPWDPLSINSFRSIISVCILLLFAKLTHHKPKFTKGVLIGAIAMCGTTSLYTAANKLTTAANTILLQFTAPLFVILDPLPVLP